MVQPDGENTTVNPKNRHLFFKLGNVPSYPKNMFKACVKGHRKWSFTLRDSNKKFPPSQYVLLKVLRNKAPSCFISEKLRVATCHSHSSTLHMFRCTDGNGRLSSSFFHQLWRQKSLLLISCVSLLPVTQLQEGFSNTLFIISDHLDLALVFQSLISSSVQESCFCLHAHNSLHLSWQWLQ